MLGVSLIRLLDLLRVEGIREAVGVSPRSIIVRGIDFSSVESVLINGVTAPEHAVLSRTELIAQVPEDQEDAIITDVSVLSTQLTMTDKSLVALTVGTRVKSISGIPRMMQVFLRQLLRSPGSNIFHPRSGGGLVKRVGTIMSPNAAADAAVAVSAARQYIINVQSTDRRIPPSERLLSAEVAGLRADPQGTSLFMTIVLTNHAGTRAAASVVT